MRDPEILHAEICRRLDKIIQLLEDTVETHYKRSNERNGKSMKEWTDLHPKRNREIYEALYPGKDCTYHPDFTTDPLRLLKEMMKRLDAEEWDNFCDKIGKNNRGHFYSNYIEIDYFIGDNPAKLRDAAWEWLSKKREEGTREGGGK